MARRFTTSWQAWKTAPSGFTAANRVSAVKRGAKTDLFAVTAAGILHTTTFDGASFTGWKKIGTDLADAPERLLSSSRLDCFGRTTGSSLWKGYFDGTAWRPANSLGGSIASRPYAVKTATGCAVLSGSSTTHLAERDSVSNAWRGKLWGDLLGSFASLRPSRLLDQPTGRLDCFAEGTDDTLQHLVRRSS